MFRTASVLIILAALHVSPAATNASDEATSPAKTRAGVRIAESLAPSLARVEITLKYDNSEEPYGGGWRTQCPSCGRLHVSLTDGVIEDERPVEIAGYLVDSTTVITGDPLMHPRFIQDIRVRMGDETVSASPTWFAARGSLMALQLAATPAGARPLAFDPARPGPYSALTYSQANGAWLRGVEPISTTVIIGDDGRQYVAAPAGALIVDPSGVPVGICLNGELPLDDSWKGSPTTWETISQAQMDSMLANFATAASHSLPRVALRFRSPKVSGQSSSYSMMDEGSATEWNGSGVLIDSHRVLVLANLKPDVTARLESITVFDADGTGVAAEFQATLRDYGAFFARLEQPLSGSALLSDADISAFRHALLLGAEIEIHGEHRIPYYTHTRIPSFEVGWKGRLYPNSYGPEQFLFTTDGELAAIPMQRREKVTVEHEWRSDAESLIPAAHLAAVLADLESNIESSNTPLSDEEENRIAWMGVELQGLDPELARANNVSQQTMDGSTGALVTWVYAGSPADAAGIEVGDILLRLHVPGHPKPLTIEGDGEDRSFGSGGFPWDRLDELPEEYFGRIPAPWPSARKSLNQKLTELGYGKAYSAEVFRDGSLKNFQFEVVQSPAHYESAPQFKHEDLGLTVRNVTYEVQRYLQRGSDEPGVVISMIEPGSRASIAGLKPFELITHINDQPVMSVGDFEQFTAGNEELRFSIKRMTRGRIVKIDPDAAIAAPADDADEPGGEDGDGGPEGD